MNIIKRFLILALCALKVIGGYGYFGYKDLLDGHTKTVGNAGKSKRAYHAPVVAPPAAQPTAVKTKIPSILKTTIPNRSITLKKSQRQQSEAQAKKFAIPNLFATHTEKRVRNRGDDSGFQFKTLAIKAAPPIDILANKKSMVKSPTKEKSVDSLKTSTKSVITLKSSNEKPTVTLRSRNEKTMVILKTSPNEKTLAILKTPNAKTESTFKTIPEKTVHMIKSPKEKSSMGTLKTFTEQKSVVTHTLLKQKSLVTHALSKSPVKQKSLISNKHPLKPSLVKRPLIRSPMAPSKHPQVTLPLKRSPFNVSVKTSRHFIPKLIEPQLPSNFVAIDTFDPSHEIHALKKDTGILGSFTKRIRTPGKETPSVSNTMHVSNKDGGSNTHYYTYYTNDTDIRNLRKSILPFIKSKTNDSIISLRSSTGDQPIDTEVYKKVTFKKSEVKERLSNKTSVEKKNEIDDAIHDGPLPTANRKERFIIPKHTTRDHPPAKKEIILSYHGSDSVIPHASPVRLPLKLQSNAEIYKKSPLFTLRPKKPIDVAPVRKSPSSLYGMTLGLDDFDAARAMLLDGKDHNSKDKPVISDVGVKKSNLFGVGGGKVSEKHIGENPHPTPLIVLLNDRSSLGENPARKKYRQLGGQSNDANEKNKERNSVVIEANDESDEKVELASQNKDKKSNAQLMELKSDGTETKTDPTVTGKPATGKSDTNPGEGEGEGANGKNIAKGECTGEKREGVCVDGVNVALGLTGKPVVDNSKNSLGIATPQHVIGEMPSINTDHKPDKKCACKKSSKTEGCLCGESENPPALTGITVDKIGSQPAPSSVAPPTPLECLNKEPGTPGCPAYAVDTTGFKGPSNSSDCGSDIACAPEITVNNQPPHLSAEPLSVEVVKPPNIGPPDVAVVPVTGLSEGAGGVSTVNVLAPSVPGPNTGTFIDKLDGTFVEDLPNVKGILSSSFSKKKYNFRSCDFIATSHKQGVDIKLHPTLGCQQISFSSLIGQLLGGEYDLAGPSDNLIVIGKFDAVGFNIDKVRERISFNLNCKELMDIIPNKLRIANGKVMLNFSYETFPKSISDFVIKIDGVIHLAYRSRVLNIAVDKAIDSTLFMIEMNARDLELPEFTKLFTQTEILQSDLPADLQTLVTSSLRNPRITGLYDSGGAFEFVASAHSPPSIFPSTPMVYVIIQKPRLGKVVSGLIVNFERAMYKTLLSTILDKDLNGLPLFKDVQTDLALGVSSDGLYVIKDAMFNKEVGALFDSGKPIKKGLTYKAKLPISNMVKEKNDNNCACSRGIEEGKNNEDGGAVGGGGGGGKASSTSSKTSSSSTSSPNGTNKDGCGCNAGEGSTEGIPTNVLIDCEITSNKMHLQFPEGLSLSLTNIGGFFGQEGQDMNFPHVNGDIGHNILSIRNYEIDDLEKKSVMVSFVSDSSMKIGTLMTLGNLEAQLKRNEFSKWSFVCTGDYQLGDTSVSVSLTSESDGFVISSKPSSIRSLLLVDVLDKTEEILKSELQMYHMDDFVIEDFRISGSLKATSIIRFAGKPALFGVETSVIEIVASQEDTGVDLLAMGLLFENVNLDKVFGRMLDRNLLRRSWAVGTNIGLFVSSTKTAADLRFEMGGLAKTRIQPGNHLRVLLLRPEPSACKGDSLCKVLSAEMPVGSAFLLDGYMTEGTLKLSETIKDPLVLSKSLILKSVALKMRIKDSVEIYVTGSLNMPGVEGVGFAGELRVDNTGHLQLKMAANDTWRNPFGLKNTAFYNSSLSATFEPGFPVPTMDVKADVAVGVDPKDIEKSLTGPVDVKIVSSATGKNTFTAKIKDISFEKLAKATGSKRQLLRFQKEAEFMDDALLSYGPHESTKEVTGRDTIHEEPGHEKTDEEEGDNTVEKSEIKLTGRVRVLGSLSDYTMKFLQDGTQLLAEVQMPDIGVNHGELTIKAGLKKHSVHSDPSSPKGPTLLIRMDPTMNSGIIVGRISALGFSRLSAIKVEDDGFSSMMFGQLPGNHSTNVTLHSMFEPNLENANFQISACLPVQKPVRDALINYLQDKAAITKKTLVAGEDRVAKTEEIFKKTSYNIKNYEGMANMFLTEMRMKGDQLVKLKEELKRRCVPDCGESCMGLPTWKEAGITLGGVPIGAPSWVGCSRRIPDLSCIVRCLGEKVIGNVRANRKQVELQGLISSLADTKNIIRTNRLYDARARNLVNSTSTGLNKVKNTIQVGQDIQNFMTTKDNNIQVDNVCFQDSLDNAERSLVNFEAATNINGAEKKMLIPSTLDGNTEYNIAEGIANNIFPGFFDFNKNLEQVKVLFSNLDGERDDIEKLMGRTNELMEKGNVEVRSEVDWNPEEIEFRKLAFGELPRFTLSDDETMRAFDDQTLWNIAPQNDPLFTKLKEENSNNKTTSNSFTQESRGGNACEQLKRSIHHYSDLITALSEFTKKFIQERSIFHRQKNHRLADLRMIDDQIKSDCFIENCTVEDMDNALSYLGKAKYGTLRWASTIENQIEDQNKVALSYFSKRASDIVEANQGLSLRSFIVRVKTEATRAMKRTIVPERRAVEDEIKEIGKELYHLLIGVRSSDDLSSSSPKIFRMRRQILSLENRRSICSNATNPDLPENLDDGTEFLPEKSPSTVVKENFMKSKFLDHNIDKDDDFVSPIIKESELDDDDEDSRNDVTPGLINSDVGYNDGHSFTIEVNGDGVRGERRDVSPHAHERTLDAHKVTQHDNTTNSSSEGAKTTRDKNVAASEMTPVSKPVNSSSDKKASEHHFEEVASEIKDKVMHVDKEANERHEVPHTDSVASENYKVTRDENTASKNNDVPVSDGESSETHEVTRHDVNKIENADTKSSIQTSDHHVTSDISLAHSKTEGGESKDERMSKEMSMINDDVLSFNNDLRLDLPDRTDRHNTA